MALPASSVLLAATTPDSLNNMNTPDFTLTPSTVTTTAIATPTSVHVPQSSAAKPAKKRKSWGQALPEPKTNLPPRKRAKTADEKEQRRIERIKRNRAAAHNSRERKRQEAERLEVENHALKMQLNALHYQMAQKDVTLDKCKEMIPGGLPQLTQEELANIKVPEERYAFPSCTCLFMACLFVH
jgi:transcriptional activator HAC1